MIMHATAFVLRLLLVQAQCSMLLIMSFCAGKSKTCQNVACAASEQLLHWMSH